MPLAAEAQVGDDLSVALGLRPVEVIQERAALPHHHEEAPSRVVVLLVNLKVGGEILNALGEKRHLHLRRAGVVRVKAVL